MMVQLRPIDLVLRILGIGACVGLSGLVALTFLSVHVNAPYLAFLPAVAVCCLLSGMAAGLGATALSAVILWLFFIPPDGWALPNASDASHLLVFLAVAFLVCWIIHCQRRWNDQLVRENFELGYKVGLLREVRATHEPSAH